MIVFSYKYGEYVEDLKYVSSNGKPNWKLTVPILISILCLIIDIILLYYSTIPEFNNKLSLLYYLVFYFIYIYILLNIYQNIMNGINLY